MALFLVQRLSVTLPLYWPGLWKGDFVWLRVSSLWSFFDAGGIVLTEIGTGLCCVWGLEIKVACCSLRGISGIFPSRRKGNLACQTWQRTKLSFSVGLPWCAFCETEEINLSVLLAKNQSKMFEKNVASLCNYEAEAFFFLPPLLNCSQTDSGNKVIYAQLPNNNGWMYLLTGWTVAALMVIIL